MQAVLNKLDVMNSQLNARIDSLETKMDALETKMDARIDALETKMDTKIDALEKSIANIKWFVGLVVALAVAAIRYLPVA